MIKQKSEYDFFDPKKSEQSWGTPFDFFYAVEQQHGIKFTLDVCADASNTKCSNYFSKEDNGLVKLWHGTPWCNPPFGNSTPAQWCKRALKFSDTLRSCILLPTNKLNQKWFHVFCIGKSLIEFVNGRIAFINPETGEAQNGNPHASMLIHYGPKIKPGIDSFTWRK